MDLYLTVEELFQLRKLEMQLLQMGREALIERVLEERENKLFQIKYFQGLLENLGLQVEFQEPFEVALPETDEGMIRLFGHLPSDEELSEYIHQQICAHQEGARMDVDIEAIALEADG